MIPHLQQFNLDKYANSNISNGISYTNYRSLSQQQD